MARILEVQSTFSSGEADPKLIERRDVEFYYSAVERGRNVVALPQGGFSNVSGTVSESLLRNPVASLGFVGATITAPNGGTAANLTDGDPATVLVTAAAGAGTVVAVHVDLGAAKTFCAFDVIGVFAELLARDQCLAVQWSTDNAAWNTIQTMDIDKTADNKRSRRFAVGPGLSVTARYLRVVTTGGAGLGTITIAGIALLQEGAYDGAVRLANFNFRQGQEYTLALTPGHGDVFFNGVWQASFSTEISTAQLAALDWTQKLDSFLAFHEDLVTPLIKRQGRNTEWNFAAYPFKNLPLYDFGGTYTNGIDAVQRIVLYNIADTEAFDLTLEGQTTTAITKDGGAVTAANIKAALEALPNVEPGITVTAASNRAFDVKFSGGENAGRPWLLMAGSGLDDDGTVVVRETTKGSKPGEPVISVAQGWPRTGIFYQQSLLVAGLKGLPRHILKSVTGSPDDFNTDIEAANGAMLFELDGGTANEITKLHSGIALLALTRDTIYYLDADTLSKTVAPNFKPTEQPGNKRGVPLASIEGGLEYVENGGNILRELKFSELQRNFSAQNVSVLSSQLLRDPVDQTHRRAIQNQENDLLYVVNGDGTLIQMTALRSENITGFTLREGTGQIRAASTDSEQNVRLAVSRTTNGATRLWLERIDTACVTDAAHVATGAGITSIAVPAAFNGEILHVFCDKAYVGTRVATASAITGLPACARIEAGYAVLPDVVDMPVLKDEEAQRPLARQKRCSTLHLSLFETDHIAVQVNSGPIYEVPLMQLGEFEVGESIGDRPFTGTVHLEGFLGFTETAQVRILGLRPGRMTVRQIRKEVRV
ncbi:discoidin domain-containing protein [Mesorhizobium sp.]|uniref:discoidin domain-containing protein n=1 Tax=Mesorhizobium sp. TaxID=1871066 RepID=UPI0011FBD3CF|nr:discoidin domain-containing protein [Mesorhizobium sp.]TIL36223.1 MAG: hypothetical protein E5Y85_00930 [Mesorhizobium sp.]